MLVAVAVPVRGSVKAIGSGWEAGQVETAGVAMSTNSGIEYVVHLREKAVRVCQG